MGKASITTITTTKITTRTAIFAGLDPMDASLLYQAGRTLIDETPPTVVWPGAVNPGLDVERRCASAA